MLLGTIKTWLNHRWRPPDEDEQRLIDAYGRTFTSATGRIVLDDLIDSIYSTTAETMDALHLADHNGQRRVVHFILLQVDKFSHPRKYELPAQIPERDVRYADELDT